MYYTHNTHLICLVMIVLTANIFPNSVPFFQSLTHSPPPTPLFLLCWKPHQCTWRCAHFLCDNSEVVWQKWMNGQDCLCSWDKRLIRFAISHNHRHQMSCLCQSVSEGSALDEFEHDQTFLILFIFDEIALTIWSDTCSMHGESIQP